MNGQQIGLVQFDGCRIVWSRRSVSNIWIPIWAQRWFESRSELKDDGSSNSFLPLLIQRHRGVTLLAVGVSSYSCLFQLGIRPNHKSMYCKGKTLSLLCDITFNAWPMFFLERSLFWYRLIGAIPPRGITGLRIKGGKRFHKMRKGKCFHTMRKGEVFPQNEKKKFWVCEAKSSGINRDLGTHTQGQRFSQSRTLFKTILQEKENIQKPMKWK